jgi:hypothetical protein
MMDSPDDHVQGDSWILDPDKVIFISGDELPLGVTEEHGLGQSVSHLFTKSREEVAANWVHVVDQMKYLITEVDTFTGDYELSEVQFQLGFSADARIGFIADAGINATVSVTFQRKHGPPTPVGAA